MNVRTLFEFILTGTVLLGQDVTLVGMIALNFSARENGEPLSGSALSLDLWHITTSNHNEITSGDGPIG